MAPATKATWLLAAPKVLQTGFAALSDWYSWRLAERLYGRGSAAAWSVVSTPIFSKSSITMVAHNHT